MKKHMHLHLIWQLKIPETYTAYAHCYGLINTILCGVYNDCRDQENGNVLQQGTEAINPSYTELRQSSTIQASKAHKQPTKHPTRNPMTIWQGDWVAQLVSRRTQDPNDEGSNPVRSTRKVCEFFRVKNVVPTRCRCSQPLCVYKNDHVCTLKILKSMSEFGGLWKHEKNQHAHGCNCVDVSVWVNACHPCECGFAPVRGALSHGDHGNCAY